MGVRRRSVPFGRSIDGSMGVDVYSDDSMLPPSRDRAPIGRPTDCASRQRGSEAASQRVAAGSVDGGHHQLGSRRARRPERAATGGGDVRGCNAERVASGAEGRLLSHLFIQALRVFVVEFVHRLFTRGYNGSTFRAVCPRRRFDANTRSSRCASGTPIRERASASRDGWPFPHASDLGLATRIAGHESRNIRCWHRGPGRCVVPRA